MKVLRFLGVLVLVVVALVFFYTWYRVYTSLHLHIQPDKEFVKRYSYLKYEERSFTTSDGVKIASWYFPVTNPKAFVVVVHGYQLPNGTKTLMLGYAKLLRDAGYSSLLIDLRSNGESPGNKISLGIEEWKDVVAAYDYLYALPEAKGKKIGYLGVSMGASTSIIAKGESGKGDFIIAYVPYASYNDLLDFKLKLESLPYFLFFPPLQMASLMELGFNYEHYDPIKEIKNIHVPITLASAKYDVTVPPDGGKLLFEAANPPKDYWESESDHFYFVEHTEQFKGRVLEFLEKYTSENPKSQAPNFK